MQFLEPTRGLQPSGTDTNHGAGLLAQVRLLFLLDCHVGDHRYVTNDPVTGAVYTIMDRRHSETYIPPLSDLMLCPFIRFDNRWLPAVSILAMVSSTHPFASIIYIDTQNLSLDLRIYV